MKTIVLQLAIQVAANVIAALLIRKWESWKVGENPPCTLNHRFQSKL